MFEKFKEKLKKSLSIFSKKAEAVEKTETAVKEIEVKEKEAQKNIRKETEKKEIEVERIEKIKEPIKKRDEQKPAKTEKEYKKESKEIKKEKITKEKETIVEKKESSKKEKVELKEEIKKNKELIKEKPIEIKQPTEPIKEEKKKEILKEKEVEEIKKEIQIEKTEPEKPKQSFFGKIKESFTTKTISAEKFEELFWELELVLLENNVSVEVIDRIKADLKKELVDQPLPRDVPKKIEETLKRTLSEILTINQIDLVKKIKQKDAPYIIAFFGINGTGKTTTIAKLTHYLQQQKLSAVLAACDTFRAAAIQQLEEHADKLKVKIIKHEYGSDAAAVAFDAIKFAEKNKIDVVMIDTAGRLHSNVNLMAELEKIIRVTKPDLKIFVGESITGNDCIEQARIFNELVEMDGAILTKVDVDEKGGAPLSIAYVIKKPILFLGIGQRYEDLEEFNPEVILKRLGF